MSSLGVFLLVLLKGISVQTEEASCTRLFAAKRGMKSPCSIREFQSSLSVESSLPERPRRGLSAMTDWQRGGRNLDKTLQFKVDCPRCRAWEIAFKDQPKTVLLKCTACGLQLKILKKSLIHYPKLQLPLPVVHYPEM